MKLRVTMLMENDKHTTVSDEELRATAAKAYKLMFDLLTTMGSDKEKATVESVEIIEK